MRLTKIGYPPPITEKNKIFIDNFLQKYKCKSVILTDIFYIGEQKNFNKSFQPTIIQIQQNILFVFDPILSQGCLALPVITDPVISSPVL